MFTDPLTILYLLSDIEGTLKTVNTVCNLFVVILSLISLIIAFFLLLIATTQNVNEAIWEYGVLRSIGLTMVEGKKLYMYESFLVVVSAAILGTFTGFMTAFILSCQFFLFIELPVQIVFPWLTLSIILALSFATTYFAVH